MSSVGTLERIGKTFGIKKGESVIAVSLFFYLLLVIACYVISKTVRDSLFLTKFGALKLPYVYIGIAIFASLFVSIYIKIARRVRQHVLLSLTLGFFVVNVVLFRWLFQFELDWLYPVLYIWAGIFGVIAPMQVWTLSNFVLTTREAKRLYGFIGGGGVLGGITGGLLSSWLVSTIGTENLLFSIAGFLTICVFLVNLIWFQAAKKKRELQPEKTLPAEAPPGSLRQSVSLITQSQYLLLIAGIITVSSVVTTMIDYQFKAVADEVLETKDQLTAFFGSFYGYLGIAAFLLQILLTSRLMRNLGIGFTIFLLPVGLVLGSVALLFSMTLWSAVLLKGPDQLFKHSVDKSTVELLYLPVPAEIKAAVKSFIDTVVWRMADGIGGVFLLGLTSLAALSTREITVVNMLLIGGWLVIAYVTKRGYVSALRSAVSKQTVDPQKITSDIQESSTVKSLITSLRSRNPEEILHVLELMSFFRDKKRLVPQLERLLEHESAEVRLKALKLLHEVGDQRLAERVRSLVRDESFEVQVAAVEFLCAHGGKVPVELTQSFLDDPDYRIKGATACVLIVSRGDEEYYVVAREVLETMVHSPDASARREAARALGHIKTSFELHSALVTLLQDPARDVRQQALQSAGEIQRREFVPLIIAQLGRKDTCTDARKALYKYGTKVLGTLRDYLIDDETELAVRKSIPLVISRIGSQEAADILLNHLHEVTPELRLAVIKGLNKLRAQEPTLRFQAAKIRDQLLSDAREYYNTLALLHAYTSPRRPPGQKQEKDLLQQALEEREEILFERLFRLLGLIYPPKDLHQAYYGTLSHEATLKANALELLDNLLQTDDKHLTLPIADDDITIGGKLRVASSLGIPRYDDRSAALSHLVEDADPIVAMAAIDAIRSHQLEALYPQIEKATHHPHPLVKETALAERPRSNHMNHITTLVEIKCLQNTMLFAHCRTDQLMMIAAIAGQVSFKAGEVIFREDDPGDSLYLIVSGKVRMKREGTAYETLIGEGETFGTLSVLDRKPRAVTATAEEDVLALKIDSEEFYELLADHIEIVQGILSRLSQQLRMYLETGEIETTRKVGAL